MTTKRVVLGLFLAATAVGCGSDGKGGTDGGGGARGGSGGTSGSAGASGAGGASVGGRGGTTGSGGIGGIPGFDGGLPNFDGNLPFDAGNHTCADLTPCCNAVTIAQLKTACQSAITNGNDQICSATLETYRQGGYCP